MADIAEEKPAAVEANIPAAPASMPPQQAPVTPPAPVEELPAWMQDLEEEKPAAAEANIPPAPPAAAPQQPPAAAPVPKIETGGLPSWLRGLDEEKEHEPAAATGEGLPAWLRDETGEAVAEPTKIQPTRPTDWHPVESKEPEQAAAASPAPVTPP